MASKIKSDEHRNLEIETNQKSKKEIKREKLSQFSTTNLLMNTYLPKKPRRASQHWEDKEMNNSLFFEFLCSTCHKTDTHPERNVLNHDVKISLHDQVLTLAVIRTMGARSQGLR